MGSKPKENKEEKSELLIDKKKLKGYYKNYL
jgi:hypothetical protein